METFSLISWTLGFVFKSVSEVHDFPNKDISETLMKVLSSLKVLNNCVKHCSGETSNALANLILREREQVLSFASRDVDKAKKQEFIFSYLWT